MKPQTVIVDPDDPSGLTVPPALLAEVLNAAERELGITFMALPTPALAKAREVWESGDDQLDRLAVSLLRDLFDGKDGHLHAIDAVLPR